MANVSIARRYARALLEVSAEAGRLDKTAQQLDAFVKAIQISPDLTDVLRNPVYARAEKAQVVEALLKALGPVEPAVANLVRLLVERHRLLHLADIARIFRDLADARSGRVRGQVTTAVPLTPEARQALERSLRQVTQREVVLETQVDPALLGGVSAQVGSVVFDGSLRTQLEELRRTLRQG